MDEIYAFNTYRGMEIKVAAANNTCVCCGAVIPEGRQVCLACEDRRYDPEEFFRAERSALSPAEILRRIDELITELERIRDR